MLAVGDIGMCGYREVGMTAELVDGIPGIVALLGDLAYLNGTERDFMECFHPAWGRHVGRSRPVPGNHEYHSDEPDGAALLRLLRRERGRPGRGLLLVRGRRVAGPRAQQQRADR